MIWTLQLSLQTWLRLKDQTKLTAAQRIKLQVAIRDNQEEGDRDEIQLSIKYYVSF